MLKARSPSCGPTGVAVHETDGGVTATGQGRFVEAITAAVPELPIADEEQLAQSPERTRFFEQVRRRFERRCAGH